MALAVIAGSTLALPGASAHHSFAMFDMSQHKLVEGRVTAWNYNNPHSWLHMEVEVDGEMQNWSFEGASPVHAARQGVTGVTFRKGEYLRVIMSPIRDGRNAGAMCFVVKEDGSYARPNDGTCDSLSIISKWEENGWLDSTENFEAHPAN
jgi:hypothetical protein